MNMINEPLVEIFRTNVSQIEDATLVAGTIGAVFPHYEINFDLDDCDRILRVKGVCEIDTRQIALMVADLGFICELFTDEGIAGSVG